MVGSFYSILASKLNKKLDSTGLIGRNYRRLGMSKNKHMYDDACLGTAKRPSSLDAAVVRLERDITDGDKVSFG